MYLKYNEEIEKAFKSGKTKEEMTKEITKEIEEACKKYEEQQKREKHIDTLCHNAAAALYEYLKATGKIKNVTAEEIEKSLKSIKIEVELTHTGKTNSIKTDNSFDSLFNILSLAVTKNPDIFSLFNI